MFFSLVFSQSFQYFKKNNQYALLINNKSYTNVLFGSIILPNKYNPFCVVCWKKEVVFNKFINAKSKKWYCEYLLNDSEKLRINDTLCKFSLPFDTLAVRYDNKVYYKIKYNKFYFLLDEHFKSISEIPYSEIVPVLDGRWFIVYEHKNDGSIRAFVSDLRGTNLIEPRFGRIRFNKKDSIFICCTSGMGRNFPDEILDVNGKTLLKYHAHALDANKKLAVFHSEIKSNEYIVVELKSGIGKKIASDSIPQILDTLLKVNRSGKIEIHTFENLKNSKK